MRRGGPFIVLVLLFLAAPTARATYDPLGGGVTRLLLDKRFAAFLDQAGVRISTEAGAARRGRVLVFPISGGRLEPTVGAGEIDQQGSLVLRSSRSRVRMRKLVVKTSHAPLVAKVGGSQLKVATSEMTGSRRDGFGTLFSARKLRLTEKVVTRLNKKLRPWRPFSRGQVIGTLLSDPQPQLTAILPTGKATLVFDSAFVAKLDQHFVAVNPVFPAEHVGPTFTLPIVVAGALAPDASKGTLRTGGQIEFLELGAGQVFWRELWFDIDLQSVLVDVEPTPAFPGKLGQVAALAFGTGTVTSEPAARRISLVGAPLTLPAETADVFNRAFAEGTNDFSSGELIGTVSFVAQGQ